MKCTIAVIAMWKTNKKNKRKETQLMSKTIETTTQDVNKKEEVTVMSETKGKGCN